MGHTGAYTLSQSAIILFDWLRIDKKKKPVGKVHRKKESTKMLLVSGNRQQISSL